MISFALETDGRNLVAGVPSAEGDSTFRACDPRTGEPTGPDIHEATPQEVATAIAAAHAAAETLRSWRPAALAALIEEIADELDAEGDSIVTTADRETALGRPRLQGELARTTHQLRMFASLVTSGRPLDAVIDVAREGPGPSARPDLRRCNVPLGPVAVFGAGNFPLAFGVPGGDTASAIAAGCPVVCKGHPSHPATSELTGRVIARALAACAAPPGSFSLLQGTSHDLGRALVAAPEICAVGFTGSLAGGRALHDLAARRSRPIPVYAEMGSLNPIFLMPDAIAERGQAIADELADSVTLGQGQFCTKPGLVFVPATPDGERFLEALANALAARPEAPLLNRSVTERLEAQVKDHTAGRITVLPRRGVCGYVFAPGLIVVDTGDLAEDHRLLEEHFGPVVVAVRARVGDMSQAARAVPASLTAAIHAVDPDADVVVRLRDVLIGQVGRLVFNGYPTGVAVTAAMHHGGPYPATTSPAHTSVGTAATRRFMRPVAFQGVPDRLLPPALRDDNPLGITRMLDGTPTTDALRPTNQDAR